MNMKIVLKLLSGMTEEKKKKKFHVSILICTMQRSKAETEKSRFVQNKGSNDCILLMYFLLPVHTI